MSGTYVGPVPVAGGGLPSDWSVVEPDGIDVGANGYANWTSPLGGNAIMETDNSEFAEWTLFPIAGGWSGDPNANIDSYIDATYASMFASLTALLRAYITVQTSGGGRTDLNLEAKNGGGHVNATLDAVDARVRQTAEDDLVSLLLEFPTEVAARLIFTATRAGINELRVGESGTSSGIIAASGAKWSRLLANSLTGEVSLELGDAGADPGGMVANSGKLYVKDNGAGKAQLIVMFDDFVPIVLATQA